MTGTAPYHSPLREAQTAATRARILEGCAAVIKTGGDLTYAAVAHAADVQERTVYRYFPTKADLEAGFWGWIVENFTHSTFDAASEEELVAAMRQAFAGFDAAAGLVIAILHSPQGLDVRRRQQQPRAAMFRRCVDATVPDAPADVRARAAAALQVLYSAVSWELLRTFHGMDAARAGDTIELAIRALLDGLRVRTSRARRGAKKTPTKVRRKKP